MTSPSTSSSEIAYLPPPGPPPLLTPSQLSQLALQGWLPLSLPSHIQDLLVQLSQTQTSFFNLPHSRKTELYPAKQGTEFGYYFVEGEKEYLTLRCRVHSVVDDGHAGRDGSGEGRGGRDEAERLVREMEEQAARLWEGLATVLRRVLVDISGRFGWPPTVWDEVVDGSATLAESETQIGSGTLMRLFRYFPPTLIDDDGVGESKGGGGAGMHTDLGLLTVCVGTEEGLQVLDRVRVGEIDQLETDGEEQKRRQETEEQCWIDVPGPVLLVGQTLRALTSDRMMAGIHRVVPNPCGRQSIVFALRHSLKHVIDLAAFGMNYAGDEEMRIDPKNLWKKLKVGVVSINAKKDAQERQRREIDQMHAARLVEKGQG